MHSYNPDEKLARKLAKMSRKELRKMIIKSNKIIKKAENNYHKKMREVEKMGKEDKI